MDVSRSRKPGIPAWYLVPIVAGIVMSPGAAAAAENAPSVEKGRGIFLEIEAWGATPVNGDLDYAFVAPSTGGVLTGGGEVATLEHEPEWIARLYVGWQPPIPDAPEIGGRFWEYDERSEDETGLRTDRVGALLANPDFVIASSIVDSAEARTRLRATTADTLVTWRPSISEKLRIDLTAGIRFFRFEETTSVDYINGADAEFLQEDIDAHGVGPIVAGGFHYLMGNRCRFGALLGLAAPTGEVDSRASDLALVGGTPIASSVAEKEESRQVFFQLDAGLRFEVDLGGGWTGTAGYLYQQWSDVRQSLRFVDARGQNVAVTEVSDVVFEGFLAGVRFAF